MLKRLLILVAIPVSVVALAASPASAAPEMRAVAHSIACPLPWVDSGFGPGSICTDVPDWVDDFPIIDKFWCVVNDVPGSDGVVGNISTIGLLDLGGFGRLRPGMQYAYFGFQPIGRPGNFAPADGRFHPTGDSVCDRQPADSQRQLLPPVAILGGQLQSGPRLDQVQA
jgi:hypothetical protein